MTIRRIFKTICIQYRFPYANVTLSIHLLWLIKIDCLQKKQMEDIDQEAQND